MYLDSKLDDLLLTKENKLQALVIHRVPAEIRTK